jgi:hypothetical protein
MSASPISFNVSVPAAPQADVNNSSAGGGSGNVNNGAIDSGNTQFGSTAKSLADVSADFHPELYVQTNVQTNGSNETALNNPAGGHVAAADNSYSLASASGSNANRTSVINPQDVALSRQAKPKFVDITIQQGGFLGMGRETVPGKEIVSPKWYSESTGEWAKMKFPEYENGKLKELGSSFQKMGCHATGVLNAANIISNRVSGETATPRNARDYQVTSSGEKTSKVMNNVGNDNVYTGDKFLNVIRNVQFYDLRSPQKFTKISQDNIFNIGKPSTISDQTMQRIKDNVNAGNPVTIGIAKRGESDPRHTAVVSGVVTDKAGKEQLMVRDNWEDKDGQAEMITLDEFTQRYRGVNADKVEVDMVWAAAAKNK